MESAFMESWLYKKKIHNTGYMMDFKLAIWKWHTSEALYCLPFFHNANMSLGILYEKIVY